MTCIVAYNDKKSKKIVMGADSAGSDGHRITLREDKKIFRREGIMIGYTTSYRFGQIIQYDMKIPRRWGKSIEKYLIKSFVPQLQKSLKRGNAIKTDKDGVVFGGTFILSIDNRIFKIYDDFQISEAQGGYCACDSGSDFAIGALNALENYELSAKHRVSEAIKSAEKSCTTVGGDIILLEKTYG